jgi:putative signal transducing protein
MEGYVSVAVFPSEVDAELAQATLAAAGIESFVQSDDSGGMMPVFQQIQGVQLWVEPQYAEEAKLVLSTTSIPGLDQ